MTTPLIAVAPTKLARGLSTTNREVTLAYQVMPLAEALATEWTTDAHCVVYVAAAPGECQPRINKDGLALVSDPVTCNVLLADVDNPGHADWTDALLAIAEAQRATLSVLATTGWYLTKHGYRLVQPLAAPVPVLAVEDLLRRWLADLAAAGVDVDPGCRDWTRHFRMPHVAREIEGPPNSWGIPTRAYGLYRSPCVDLSGMRPISLVPLVAPTAARGPRVQRSGQSPFFCAAEIAGWIGRPRGGGYWTMTCPWAHEHTTPGGTAVYERGGPVCAHAHCATRTFLDWLDALPAVARQRYEDLTNAELSRNAAAAHAAARSKLRQFWGGGK